VKYTLATRLVNELVEAADGKTLARTIARYGRVDLLLVDELGYMELDRRGAELLFQVLTRGKRKTVSRSHQTRASPAVGKRSPTHASAQQSSTVSPTAATSSKPAPSPTTSPRPKTSYKAANA
jgi:nucleoside-triphosphatase THEP1